MTATIATLTVLVLFLLVRALFPDPSIEGAVCSVSRASRPTVSAYGPGTSHTTREAYIA